MISTEPTQSTLRRNAYGKLARTSMRIFLFLIFYCLMITSCGASRGVYHRVGKGDTLWRISKAYGVSARTISNANRIRDPSKIRVGQKLFIPGRSKVIRLSKRSNSISTTNKGRKKSAVRKKRSKRARIVKGRFVWPVKGTLLTPYGALKNGTKNDGIDIKAREGTAIKASDSGEVVHAASDMRVFGSIIIIKHKGDFYTLYAHNKKNLVKKGDHVKRGDTIARVGRSGDAKESKLHFELRDGTIVRNPLSYLP